MTCSEVAAALARPKMASSWRLRALAVLEAIKVRVWGLGLVEKGSMRVLKGWQKVLLGLQKGLIRVSGGSRRALRAFYTDV